jgi:hypothetical protein
MFVCRRGARRRESDFLALFRQRDRSPWLEALPRALTHEGVIFGQHVREGRFQRGLAAIAGLSSILAGLEVSYEHYRGSYSRRLMYTPVLVAPLLVGAGLWAVKSRRAARTALPLISALTLVDGLVGFYYHVRGVARKPGGWRIPLMNMNMGPPVFAPLLFGIPAYIGLVASLMRRGDDPRRLPRWVRPRPAWLGWLPRRWRKGTLTLDHEVREGRFQKHMAAATALWSLLCGAEAYYSHYKNNYKYKMQWTPVIIAPLLTATSIAAMFHRRTARTLLPAASLLAVANGSLGFYYHARGVGRRAGGIKHLLYNVMYGPPVFAPLLLGACGLLGVLTSLLRRER